MRAAARKWGAAALKNANRGYVVRFLRLCLGLLVSATGIVMMYEANVGLDPWNVLHEGISIVTGISLGRVTIFVGAAAVLAAVLLGERIGIGTLLNIFACGVIIDWLIDLKIIPMQTQPVTGVLLMLAGLEVLTVGTYFCLEPGLGAGPRDALMVGVAKKTKWSVGLCRSATELVVVLLGWFLGGKVGVGTLISALGIGLLFDLNFRLLHFTAADVQQEDLRGTAGKLRAWALVKVHK